MTSQAADILSKLKWSLPWLVRYPFWRARTLVSSGGNHHSPTHIVFVIANHFEPGAGEQAVRSVEHWCNLAHPIGSSLRDHDGTPFRHTYFFPAEQYDAASIDMLAALQSEGLGEVEVHLHHGVDQPDNAVNTRRMLETFRDTLADKHRCLSRESSVSLPKYAFVHGNLALANSAGGRNCGVDSEMEVLAATGCYADFTLPSAPDQSQVPKINAIYQCGNPLGEASPHRSGPDLKVGDKPTLPIIITGPLVFDWTRRVRGLPIPRVDDGALARNYPLKMDRFERWQSAQIGVQGRPEWIFIKLHCHGFFHQDQDAMIGDEMKRFMSEILERGDATGSFKIHFATAREVFNMVLAALAGEKGDPGQYRDYYLRQILKEGPPQTEIQTEIQPQTIHSDTPPSVSVIIPAYNAAKYIGEALNSVFDQTFRSHESIVINDGSPDTVELERKLESYGAKVQYIKQENRGAAAARNAGLRSARGEYVAFLDADDRWLPNFLEEQIEFLKLNNADFVYSDALLFGETPLAGRTFMEIEPPKRAVTPESLLAVEATVLTSAVLSRKKPIFEVGLFDEGIERGHDFELWFRLAKAGIRFAYQPRVLAEHRIVESGLSGDALSQLYRTLSVLEAVKAKGTLTQSEDAALNLSMKRTLGVLALENGKEKLLGRDFQGALECFQEARRYRQTWKLRLVSLGVRIAPETVRRLHKLRNGATKSG